MREHDPIIETTIDGIGKAAGLWIDTGYCEPPPLCVRRMEVSDDGKIKYDRDDAGHVRLLGEIGWYLLVLGAVLLGAWLLFRAIA